MWLISVTVLTFDAFLVLNFLPLVSCLCFAAIVGNAIGIVVTNDDLHDDFVGILLVGASMVANFFTWGLTFWFACAVILTNVLLGNMPLKFLEYVGKQRSTLSKD